MTIEDIIRIYSEVSGKTIIPIIESVSTIKIAPAVKRQSITLLYKGKEWFKASITGVNNEMENLKKQIVTHLFNSLKDGGIVST